MSGLTAWPNPWERRYSDDQPRDENGRWGEGSGDSSSKSSGYSKVFGDAFDKDSKTDPKTWEKGMTVASPEGKEGKVTGYTGTGAIVTFGDGSQKIARDGDGYTLKIG